MDKLFGMRGGDLGKAEGSVRCLTSNDGCSSIAEAGLLLDRGAAGGQTTGSGERDPGARDVQSTSCCLMNLGSVMLFTSGPCTRSTRTELTELCSSDIQLVCAAKAGRAPVGGSLLRLQGPGTNGLIAITKTACQCAYVQL